MVGLTDLSNAKVARAAATTATLRLPESRIVLKAREGR